MKKIVYFLTFTFLGILYGANCSVYHVTSCDKLNVRNQPNYKAQKIGELPYNAKKVHIIHCVSVSNSSPWCKIRYKSGSAKIVGWVNSKYLACTKPKKNYYCVKGVQKYDTLSVRIYPTYKSKKIGELSPYAKGIKKIKCVGNWCKIRYKSGSAKIVGWVNSRYLKSCQKVW